MVSVARKEPIPHGSDRLGMILFSYPENIILEHPFQTRSKRIGECYGKVIEWTLNFRQTRVDEEFERLRSLAANMSTNCIREVEEFTEHCYDEVRKAISNTGGTAEEPRVLNITLTLTIPDMSEYYEEHHRVFQRYL